MHPLRLPHGLLLRKHSAPRQSQAKMVALEGLNFKFLALVFKFDLLNLNSAGLCRTQAHFSPRKKGAKNLFFKFKI